MKRKARVGKGLFIEMESATRRHGLFFLSRSYIHWTSGALIPPPLIGIVRLTFVSTLSKTPATWLSTTRASLESGSRWVINFKDLNPLTVSFNKIYFCKKLSYFTLLTDSKSASVITGSFGTQYILDPTCELTLFGQFFLLLIITYKPEGDCCAHAGTK